MLSEKEKRDLFDSLASQYQGKLTLKQQEEIHEIIRKVWEQKEKSKKKKDLEKPDYHNLIKK